MEENRDRRVFQAHRHKTYTCSIRNRVFEGQFLIRSFEKAIFTELFQSCNFKISYVIALVLKVIYNKLLLQYVVTMITYYFA